VPHYKKGEAQLTKEQLRVIVDTLDLACTMLKALKPLLTNLSKGA
jgi:hypothetical protein